MPDEPLAAAAPESLPNSQSVSDVTKLDHTVLPRALMAWDTINFLFGRVPRHMWHQSAFDVAPAPQVRPAAMVVAPGAVPNSVTDDGESKQGLDADGDVPIEGEANDDLDATEFAQATERAQLKAQHERILEEEQQHFKALRESAKKWPPHCIVIDPATLEEPRKEGDICDGAEQLKRTAGW